MSSESPQGVVLRAVYLSAVHSVSQTFAFVNTAQVVDFDTLLESQTIINLGNGEFQVKDTGAYTIECAVQVKKTLNDAIAYDIWLQKDTGSGFVDVNFSATQNELTGLGLLAVQSKSVIYIFELKLNTGDKIRLQNAVDNTNATLMAGSPIVGPFIPSSRILITKTGRL